MYLLEQARKGIDRLQQRLFSQIPPRFVIERDEQTGKKVYLVEPRLRSGHRFERQMPVNPEYDTLTDIELLGVPQVVHHEELAASPRNQKRPTLTQLQNVDFYRNHVMTPPEQSHLSSPVEINPFATNVFVFPAINVQYTYGVQAIGQESDGLVVTGAVPRVVHDGKIEIAEPCDDTLEGLAYVGHVRVPVNLSDFFYTPVALQEFNGEVPLSSDSTGEEMQLTLFQDVFQQRLEHVGEQVAELRGKPVRGILTSPVGVYYRLHDNGIRLTPNPEGELVMAASYLV